MQKTMAQDYGQIKDGIKPVGENVFYCNNCINGDWFNGTFIEKCETWEIGDDNS
jgi:hypothetical protein